MSLSQVLQPYVCCLGNPVAGNPTQFIMYRAARASGVDWRFFTSQVAIDQFEIAFRGVQALGLNGAAFFTPFQSQAISLLESVTEAALCMGLVNVARSDGNSWLGENTLGLALTNCIESHRGSLGFAGEVAVVGDKKIAKIMRLASPTFFDSLRCLEDTVAKMGLDSPPLVEADGNASPMSPSTDATESFDQFISQQRQLGFLVLAQLPSGNDLKRIASLSWSDNAACILLGSATEKQSRPLLELLHRQKVRFVAPVDLMAHQAAADFHFWTGVQPSVDLMRDSLEEYLQW